VNKQHLALSLLPRDPTAPGHVGVGMRERRMDRQVLLTVGEMPTISDKGDLTSRMRS